MCSSTNIDHASRGETGIAQTCRWLHAVGGSRGLLWRIQDRGDEMDRQLNQEARGPMLSVRQMW